jgi:hypothetical protein
LCDPANKKIAARLHFRCVIATVAFIISQSVGP